LTNYYGRGFAVHIRTGEKPYQRRPPLWVRQRRADAF